ncbi:MAG: flavodoxin [Marinifilaceae bacterium]
MERIGIIYGSTTGNTESAAQTMQKLLGADQVDIINVENASSADLDKYTNLIFGTSTWGVGDLQDDFESFLSDLESAALDGKVIALFGFGDSSAYADTFVDGMGIIYEAIDGKGATIVGEVSAESYDFEASRAEDDGEFVGLALDEENEGHLSEERIEQWINLIQPKFN